MRIPFNKLRTCANHINISFSRTHSKNRWSKCQKFSLKLRKKKEKWLTTIADLCFIKSLNFFSSKATYFLILSQIIDISMRITFMLSFAGIWASLIAILTLQFVIISCNSVTIDVFFYSVSSVPKYGFIILLISSDFSLSSFHPFCVLHTALGVLIARSSASEKLTLTYLDSNSSWWCFIG